MSAVNEITPPMSGGNRKQPVKGKDVRPPFPNSLRAILRWAWVPVVSFVLVVAAAMACAVWSPAPSYWWGGSSSLNSAGELPAALRNEVLLDRGYRSSSVFGFTYYDVRTEEPALLSRPAIPLEFGISFGRAGFPFRCLRWTDDRREQFAPASILERGVELSRFDPNLKFERRVPLMPEWAGLLFNVLAYSIVITLIRAVFHRERARFRLRRARCAACAYPVEPRTDRCPECGTHYPFALAAAHSTRHGLNARLGQRLSSTRLARFFRGRAGGLTRELVVVPAAACMLVVLVALTCARWAPRHHSWRLLGDSPPLEVVLPDELSVYDAEDVYGRVLLGVGLTFYVIVTDQPPVNKDIWQSETRQVKIGRAGWPFRCMRWAEDVGVDPRAAARFWQRVEDKQPVDSERALQRLPLEPEFAGLSYNGLIYWAAFVALRAASRRDRVFRRMRRGVCVKCRYPVEPSIANCPECGGAYAGAASEEASHA